MLQTAVAHVVGLSPLFPANIFGVERDKVGRSGKGEISLHITGLMIWKGRQDKFSCIEQAIQRDLQNIESIKN